MREQWRKADGRLDLDRVIPYVREHGCLPPEVEASLIDVTDRVMREAARLRDERSS